MPQKTLIAPSILAADWGRFRDEIVAVTAAGADWIHVDVMDGHFVPPITFGPGVVEAARKATALPLDVHLMIEQPEKHIEAFAKAGASRITVHQETCPHLHRVIEQIHALGVGAGVAINPATSVELISDIVEFVDLVLIMSVNPGWGGQKYIASSVEKLREAAAMVAKLNPQALLEVDGGINPQTAGLSVQAGANVLVAGTSVFREKDYRAALEALRSAP